jgi:hypothetical protein
MVEGAPDWTRHQLLKEISAPTILIVDLPTRLDNKQENDNASHSHHGKRYKKCFHDLRSKKSDS